MGWNGEYRPSNWPMLRETTLRAANYRCNRCGNPANEADHIIPVSQGGSHTLDNLQALCPPCHRIKTQHEATQARKAIQAKRTRPTNPHPGDTTPQPPPPTHPGGPPPPPPPHIPGGA